MALCFLMLWFWVTRAAAILVQPVYADHFIGLIMGHRMNGKLSTNLAYAVAILGVPAVGSINPKAQRVGL